MSESFVSSLSLAKYPLWDRFGDKRTPLAFDLEVTARCNNNCRHCYINVPASDRAARGRELTLDEIKRIADEAVSLGALWCLITGGEPLIREDFSEIYLMLKKKGLLVSVFTNAGLITDEVVKLFKTYPPRNLEVTVYGVTPKTYERVTRTPGSFRIFQKGLSLLLRNGIPVRLKSMALRSNKDDLPKISAFCRKRTIDYFRFDPFLHLRLDGDSIRNGDIKNERLSAEEIVDLERADRERFQVLEKSCDSLIFSQEPTEACGQLFRCGIANSSFTISSDGFFCLCPSLRHPDCLYDLRKGTLKEAWEEFSVQVLRRHSKKKSFIETCRVCSIVNLCLWCPAHAHLETGELDEPIDYFCKIAHARAEALLESKRSQGNNKAL